MHRTYLLLPNPFSSHTLVPFILLFLLISAAPYSGECEDPYPSLSDYHDYEPNLEFDDSDLHQKHPEGPDGKFS